MPRVRVLYVRGSKMIITSTRQRRHVVLLMGFSSRLTLSIYPHNILRVLSTTTVLSLCFGFFFVRRHGSYNVGILQRHHHGVLHHTNRLGGRSIRHDMQPLSDHEKALAEVSTVLLFCKSRAVTLAFGVLCLFARGGSAFTRGGGGERSNVV